MLNSLNHFIIKMLPSRLWLHFKSECLNNFDFQYFYSEDYNIMVLLYFLFNDK